MLKLCLTLLCAAALSACQVAASPTTPTPAAAASPSPVEATPTLSKRFMQAYPPVGHNRWLYEELNIQNLGANMVDSDSSAGAVSYVINGLSITLEKPEGWTVHPTEDGIILIERIGSISSGGELQGMMATVFVTSLDRFTLPVGTHANAAYAVLSQVTQNPAYVGSALISAPAAFKWNGYDAAYYLMSTGTGTVGIVLAVMSPLNRRLLAVNVAAPMSKASGIRPMLPVLLKNLSVNGVLYGSADLSRLPDPLAFPRRASAALRLEP